MPRRPRRGSAFRRSFAAALFFFLAASAARSEEAERLLTGTVRDDFHQVAGRPVTSCLPGGHAHAPDVTVWIKRFGTEGLLCSAVTAESGRYDLPPLRFEASRARLLERKLHPNWSSEISTLDIPVRFTVPAGAHTITVGDGEKFRSVPAAVEGGVKKELEVRL